MANMEITREMRARLIRAKDLEEVRVLLGPDETEEEIERAWQEIEAHRPAGKLEDLDDDELEAVSGGADRDWEKDGCSASVEEGSWCGSYDKCNFWDVTCDNFDPCPKGGRHIWKFCTRTFNPNVQLAYICKCEDCGKSKTVYVR